MQVNVQCPFCQSPEDMHHAILSWHWALTFWKDLEPLLTHTAGRTLPLTFDTLVFRRNLPRDEQANGLCYHILAAGAELLWRTQNKYFFNLERAKQEQARISKMSTENGEVTSDEQIL